MQDVFPLLMLLQASPASVSGEVYLHVCCFWPAVKPPAHLHTTSPLTRFPSFDFFVPCYVWLSWSQTTDLKNLTLNCMIVAASQEKGPNECAARRAPRLTLQFMLFSDCLQSWNFALRIYGPIKSVCGFVAPSKLFQSWDHRFRRCRDAWRSFVSSIFTLIHCVNLVQKSEETCVW